MEVGGGGEGGADWKGMGLGGIWNLQQPPYGNVVSKKGDMRWLMKLTHLAKRAVLEKHSHSCNQELSPFLLSLTIVPRE